MNYYPFHIGDYASHTRGLSLLEDLAYRRLLDEYYLHERPLNDCSATVARQIGMIDHLAAVEYILTAFFEHTEEGYINRRADQEIKRFHSKQEAASKAGKASAERRLNERPTVVERPSTNQNQNQNHTSSSTKKSKTAAPKPIDVSDDVWGSYLLVRKSKRAGVPTDKIVLALREEAVKAGLTLEQALTTCAMRGWVGFEAAWINKGASQQRQSFYEQDQAAKRRQWEEMTGRKWPTENDPNVIEATTNTLEIEQ